MHDLPQSPEHCSPTKYARGSCRSHRDVVMLFFPSFTQSELLLHTDQLITRLRRVEPATFCSHDVFKSDAVIWWAAIFRSPSSIFDKMLHLSKSQGSAVSRLRCHGLREAINDLLTVSMHLQDSLSRFHRPGLHKIDLRVHVAGASTRTLAFHESQSC